MTTTNTGYIEPIPLEERRNRAKLILRHPEDYKVCCGCGGISRESADVCHACGGYRWETGPTEVQKQARRLAKL